MLKVVLIRYSQPTYGVSLVEFCGADIATANGGPWANFSPRSMAIGTDPLEVLSPEI